MIAYVPPVVITNFTIFNRPVRIGAESVLKKAIPYVESLTLSYADNVFSVRVRCAELRQFPQEPLSIQARGLRS